MKKLKIDWNNLIDAYTSEQEDYLCYLDTSSGTVMWKSSEVMAKVTKDDKKSIDKHLIEVPTISSREGWELMMDFVDKINNRQMKNKLSGAVQGKGAFRRFKEIVTKSPSDQEQWFTYQDAAVTKILEEWLVSMNIESQNTPVYSVKVGDRVRLDKPPFEQELLDQILFTADAIVGNGDKTFLAQVLKGSKAKAVKDKNGESLPGYAVFNSMTIKQINELVDKTIQTQWLKVSESEDNQGLLEHSRKGWDRIKDLWSEKILVTFFNASDEATIKEFVTNIMGRHREIRQHFLDILFRKADKSHIPVIDAWKNEEVRKFRKRLLGLLRKLGIKSPPQPGTKPKPPTGRQPHHANRSQQQTSKPPHSAGRPQHSTKRPPRPRPVDKRQHQPARPQQATQFQRSSSNTTKPTTENNQTDTK